jgi:hypothetical protein
MLNIWGRLCVAVATLVFAQTVSVKAQDAVMIAGVGTLNCDSWTRYVRYPYESKPDANAVEIGVTSWALGYASAVAVYGGPGVLRSNGNNSFIDAISRRCKDFPSARIDAVIEKILKEAP